MNRIAFRLLTLTLFAMAACANDDDDDGDFQSVTFPEEFLWGTASAAYQAEGTEDPELGQVTSNWWEWEELGRIAEGQRNPQGAGFFTLYDEDFQLAEDLGNNAYRFGLEWARIEPERGVFNQDAIDHYRDVLISARAHGLEPVVTLYHWVVPNWVQSPITGLDLKSEPPWAENESGKTVLKSALGEAMLPYVRRMAEEYGDLVDIWVVLNEPYSVLLEGYLTGGHPNGELLQIKKMRDAGLNYILTYPAAYDAIKAGDTVDADGDGLDSRVGNAVVGSATFPIDPESQQDIDAAQRIGYILNDWMMNAWHHGNLDVNGDQDYDDADGVVPEGDYADQLAGRMDYVGLNYYSSQKISYCPSMINLAGDDPATIEIATNLQAIPQIASQPGHPRSENGLEVNAEGLLETLRHYDQYTHGPDGRRDIIIMENGHGDCDDDQRAKFITEHLYQIGLAIAEEIPVKGYMLWSLTDNFEWSSGRNNCFGIYRVDYDTFERIPTRTVPLYESIIAGGKIDKAIWEEYASGRYPTDCISVEDPAEKQECLDNLPPNPMDEIQMLIDTICGAQ